MLKLTDRWWPGRRSPPNLPCSGVMQGILQRQQEGRTTAMSKTTSRGQATIPKDVQERLGLRSGDKVEFVED